MKIIIHSLVVFLLLFLTGCNARTGADKNSGSDTDTTMVPDTGYTGITKGMSGQYLVNEVTYKNGVRHGLTKTFYHTGQLRTKKWYVNGVVQDSICWFYEEGQLFRTTPYKNDTVDGVQKQYYRTGELKAKIYYSKGHRIPRMEEFTREGKLVSGYPEVVVKTQDDYKSNGSFRINLELSDKLTRVDFFRGEFINGLYDTTKVRRLSSDNKTGQMVLKKTNSPKQSYVGVIAEISTNFGNKMLVYKRIDLPYADLE